MGARVIAQRAWLAALAATGTIAWGWGTATPAWASSPFAWRGVVEGQYGTPWDHAERMRLLAFLGAHGFNAYVHAPKEDQYGRTQWREPYPVAQQAQFDEEIALARRLGVQWIPDVSPGVPLIPTPAPPNGSPSAPICFSCPGDLDVLVAKFAPFLAAGSHAVMVSFDDAQKALVYPQDIVAYGTGDAAYGRANADLLNRLLTRLRSRDPAARLLVVGADYSGTSDTPYLQGLRSKLSPAIEVLWTGTAVGSRNFTPAQVSAYAQAIGRKPVVWDNWTVDDSDGNIVGQTQRVHLGSYPRGADIVNQVRGFLLNPMNEADLNELPFLTAADYFADPLHYDAPRSYAHAVSELGGPAAQSLRAFGEVNFSDPFDPAREAPTFVAMSSAYLAAYRSGGLWPSPAQQLAHELALVANAGPALAAQPSLRFFVAEAAPFLSAARTAAAAGVEAAALLTAERPRLAVQRSAGGFAGRAAPPDPVAAGTHRQAMESDYGAMLADPRQVYGYRGFVFDIPPIPAPPNKMGLFLDQVRALDRAWLPTATRASARVRLLLDGRPVAIGRDGRFELAPGAAGHRLEAVDGAGGRTALRLPGAPSPSRAAPGCPRQAMPVSAQGTRRARARPHRRGRPRHHRAHRGRPAPGCRATGR